MKIAVSGNKDDFAERLRNYCEKYPTDGVEVFLAGSQDADVVVTEEEEVCPDGVFHIVWTEVEEQKENQKNLKRTQLQMYVWQASNQSVL